MTQLALAERLNVHGRYVWKLEHGVKPPPEQALITRIAEVLALDDVEQLELTTTARQSLTRLDIPVSLDPDRIRTANRFIQKLETLAKSDFEQLRELIDRL